MDVPVNRSDYAYSDQRSRSVTPRSAYLSSPHFRSPVSSDLSSSSDRRPLIRFHHHHLLIRSTPYSDLVLSLPLLPSQCSAIVSFLLLHVQPRNRCILEQLQHRQLSSGDALVAFLMSQSLSTLCSP